MTELATTSQFRFGPKIQAIVDEVLDLPGIAPSVRDRVLGAIEPLLHIRDMELEDAISRALNRSSGTASGWDAIIDPDLAADAPSLLKWKTVGAALTYYSGLGYSANQGLRIGITGRHLSAVVTETINFTAAMCPPAGVLIQGLVPKVRWKLPASHTIAGNSGNTDVWVFKDMFIDATGIGGSATWITSTGMSVIFDNVCFSGQQSVNSTNTATKIVAGGGSQTQAFMSRDCVFQYSAATCATILCDHTWWFFQSGSNTVTLNNASTSSAIYMNGGGFGGGGSNTVTLAAEKIVMTGISGAVPSAPSTQAWGYSSSGLGLSSPGGAITLACTGATNGTVFATTAHGGRSSDNLVSISTNGAKYEVTIIGQWQDVTMGGKATRANLDVIANGSVTAYGPCSLRAVANIVSLVGSSTNVASVQGESIRADLVIQQSSGGSAGLTVSGVADSAINVSGAPSGARQAFTFDNKCWRNVLNWAGYSQWSVPSADAGTGNVTPIGTNTTLLLDKAQST